MDDEHHELSLVEFITFYVTYYETDQISETLFFYCDYDQNNYLSPEEFAACYCDGFDEGHDGDDEHDDDGGDDGDDQ